MTIRALFRRGLIKQNRFALYLALQRVAHRASDVCMSSLQRELRPLVVIECRWRPSLDHMTIRALGNPVLCGKLRAVRVGMARFAILWCACKLNVMRALNRFVAIAAGDRAMSAH